MMEESWPTITEAFSDGHWHTVKYVYSIAGLDYVTVSGNPVRWRVSEQPRGDALALASVPHGQSGINQYALHAGDWRTYRETDGMYAAEVEAPTGFGVWAGVPKLVILQ